MENYNEVRDDEIEIDLKELLLVLWHKAWVIVLAGILFGGVALGYTNFLVTPLYEAQSSIYILSSSTSITSLTDIQLSSALTEDYVILGTSRPVVEEVIENLALEYTYEELVEMISLSNPSDSHVLEITASNPSASLAMDISNEFADVISDQVASVMATETPRNVERAVVAENPSSPSILQNTAIGILLGFVLAAGIIVVIFVLDDTIKSEDDVTKYLGKNVLATLPKEGNNRKMKKDNMGHVSRNIQSSRTVPERSNHKPVRTTAGTNKSTSASGGNRTASSTSKSTNIK